MAMFGVIWGVGGVLMLLGMAVIKLTPPSLEAFNFTLSWYHWLVLVLNTAIVLYFKGYRALHLALAPRIAARAVHLSQNPSLKRVLLAPFFCMGYFDIIKRKKIATYAMTVGMVALIMLVRTFPQPMRGVVDLAVTGGLAMGFLSLVLRTAQAFWIGSFDYSPMMAD